jgi:putative restriction endonuclease
MSINLIVAVTDDDWFRMLSRMPALKEVNFWAPSDSTFRALRPGELFLFKLRAPYNAIVGGAEVRQFKPPITPPEAYGSRV